MAQNEDERPGDPFLRQMLGYSPKEARAAGLCIVCKKSVNPKTDFKDELSIREYGITAHCQSCQDKVFGAEEPQNSSTVFSTILDGDDN